MTRGWLQHVAPRLPDDEVVIRGQADVARLADITDPCVLLFVATADSGVPSVEALSEMIISKSS